MPSGIDQSTKPDRVQGAFLSGTTTLSGTWYDSWGWPMQGQELGFDDPFQFRIFYVYVLYVHIE